MTEKTGGTLRGTVQKFKDARGRVYYRARITYPDGVRLWLQPRFDKRERAEEYANAKSREAERRGVTVAKMAPPAPKSAGDTCDVWHTKYLAYCVERGITTTGDKGYRWGKWIAPRIGAKPMASVERPELEAIRDDLDTAIRDGRIRAKTAANVWAEVTGTFAEACSSKREGLRARQDNPASGIQPPERGSDKSKVYPYPSEFLTVASCEDIPLEWREIHTIAAYTFLRPGELWVLEWADVDLDDGRISVTKAWDFKNARVKGTKTGETRTIPIEPTLLPLLARMKRDAGGAGLVVPLLSQTDPDKLAQITRAHFETAKCTRPRLLRQSATERHVVFRSWRDAGCTWSIVRGDDVVKVQRRAGHRIISTTMRYVVEAENRGSSFGTPFPVLPDALIVSKDPSKRIGSSLQAAVIAEQSVYRRRDSNPHALSDGGF
jgi:integrase